MPIPPQQIGFPSLDFDRDRTVLYVGEVAGKWRVSEQHVIDLLEEGKLNGFDIAGRHEYIRVPKAALAQIAALCKTDEATLLKIIVATRPARATPRAFWRIPVKEGFQAFMEENHSKT